VAVTEVVAKQLGRHKLDAILNMAGNVCLSIIVKGEKLLWMSVTHFYCVVQLSERVEVFTLVSASIIFGMASVACTKNIMIIN
jgi:hypothetical protein